MKKTRVQGLLSSRVIRPSSLINKKVLITCGPTWVPIDEVRVISNRSTGQMGHILARDFKQTGAKVTLIEGPCTDTFTASGITVRKFYFYDELLRLLKTELKKKFDVVVHAAAVSDYRVKNPYQSKLRSGLSSVKLTLVPTQKIINIIRRLAPQTTLVGFKLEPVSSVSTLQKKGVALAYQADCDFVVANNLKNNHYQGYILNAAGEMLASASSRAGLSQRLIKTLKDYR